MAVYGSEIELCRDDVNALDAYSIEILLKDELRAEDILQSRS